MSDLTILSQSLSVVLVEPLNDINIGSVVRACKNFGVSSIRLVNPARANPAQILVSAPRAEDLIDRIERYTSLDEALSDCTMALGMTARQRRNKRLYLEPRGAAADLIAIAREQASLDEPRRVALVFGREDSGLSNEDLDRCNALVTIPTNPDYSSLNLAQAVLLMLWETFRAGTDAPIQRLPEHIASPQSDSPLASHEELERMTNHAERVLARVGFLKESSHKHMMSTIQEMFKRAGLDQREVAIWHGIFSQTSWALDNPERLADIAANTEEG